MSESMLLHLASDRKPDPKDSMDLGRHRCLTCRQVARVEVLEDWTTLDLKKAIGPFLGKGVAVSAIIHEGRGAASGKHPSRTARLEFCETCFACPIFV